MTTSQPADDLWERAYRWGPWALLATGTVLSLATAGLLITPAERVPTGVLVLVAAGWEAWWSARRADSGCRGRAGYYIGRAVLAFVLSWLNPFFAVYALMGYFDATRLLPERWVRVGLLATAVTMAGSQSGGLPPSSLMTWIGFGLLFALNAAIGTVTLRIGERDQARTRELIEAIAELERTNVRLEQALSENQALHGQLLLQAREAGIDDERRRLAAEIHDTLAQGLTGIITQLQAAQDTTDSAAAGRHVERAAALARRSLGEARRSVQNLAPQALEHSALEDALARTVETWGAESGIRADFTVTGTVEPLHDDIGATLLRITQEALANVSKHADAERVGVTVSYMDDEVSLDVRDDGCGFDPEAGSVHGFGLRGMQSRAARIAGAVNIESEPGAGTAVSVRVPLVRAGAME